MIKLNLNDSNIPLLGDALEAKVQIVEPPSIGVGGIGTTATTAQVRLSAELSADGIPLVGGLLNLVGGGTNLKLPLTIDGIKSSGELMQVCDSDGAIARNQAVIDVASSLAEIKISTELSVGHITQIGRAQYRDRVGKNE